MDRIGLDIEKRNNKGSLSSLRNSGYIPGIVYGKNVENMPIQIKESIFRENIINHGRNTVFNIDLDNGKTQPVVIKEIQYDRLRNEFLHVDFQGIALNESREASVPIRISGRDGINNKGIVVQQMNQIRVECLPQDVPEYIEINISDFSIGDSFLVSDLVLPEDIKVNELPEEVIATVSSTRTANEDLNNKDETDANEVPIIGNDERETNAT